MRTLFILLIAVVSGQAEAWRVPWNQTPEVFAGKFVTVHLASGTLIGGTWIHVTPSAFTIKVSHSSNQTEVAQGVRVLPRSSIVKVGFRKCQVHGRVIGAVAGFFGTGFATAKISQALNPGDPNLGTGFIAIAGGVAGYWVGRHFDHRAIQEISSLE